MQNSCNKMKDAFDDGFHQTDTAEERISELHQRRFITETYKNWNEKRKKDQKKKQNIE